VTKKLEILLLGPPIVRWNGELISIQRRLPRALLFYLAWQGTMVPRETLLDLFWEKGIKAARARLTENISRLRATLPIDNLILAHAGLIGLNLDQIYIDRLHFEYLIDQAGRVPWQIPENEPLTTNIYQMLIQANNLWRDTYALQGVFLPTSALDDWLQQSTRRMEGLRFNVLMRLSDHAYTMLDYQGGLNFARAALQYDPYNRKVHLKILQNLVKLGKLREAQQYFENTREMILNELGINPTPDMINIYKNIRTLEDAPLPDIEPRWEIHPSVEVPFVGRENAFSEINQIIAKQHAVFIIGESGQGKSRLIQEFTAQIKPQPRLLLTVCRPMESALPFHPFVELFRRHVTPDEWLTLPAVWANHLVGLLPELVQIRDDLNQITILADSVQAQGMIFESIRQVLVLMNKTRPLFLVIDDAHWADEATLSTIAYILVRDPFTSSASLALIARSEDITDSLQTTMAAAQQSKHASIFKLQNLRRENIISLAYHLLKDQPSDEFISRLIVDTGGNTFFVLEILRAIIEGNTNFHSRDSILPLTENLQNLIQSRIQNISSPSREAFEVAALIGTEFSVPVLGKVCLKTPEELASILDELENKLLILPHEQRYGELFYRFAHDKIRETLLQHIPAARSQVLHGRIVQTLNKTSQQAAVLAHHYSGAGELRTAFLYWTKAAERARSLFSGEDASHSYARAEEILQQIFPEVNNEEINRFYAGWGDLAYNASETDLLKHIGHELIRLGKIRENPLLIGSGLDTLSNACMTINNFELGLEYANQAISHLAETENWYGLVEAYNHRGTFLYMLNHLEEALIAFQDALALCTDVSDPKINKALSNAHYQTALLQILFGKPINGYEHGLMAFEFAEQINHTYSIIQAYGIQSLAQFYMGEFIQARDTALKGIEIAERIQGWRMLGYLNSYAAMAEVALGYLDEACSHAEIAVQIGQKYEQYDISALGYRAFGEIYRLLHDYSLAMEYFQKGYNGLPNHFLGFDNLYRLGLAQSYLENSDNVDLITLAKRNLEENSVEIGIMSAKLCLALVYAKNSEWEKVKPVAIELGSETLTNGLGSYHINAIGLLAEVAAAEGDFEFALEQFQCAAEEAQFLHNPWLEIKSQAAIEKILESMGENTSRPRERIKVLLDQLESKISHAEMRPVFHKFREQVSMRTCIATDSL